MKITEAKLRRIVRTMVEQMDRTSYRPSWEDEDVQTKYVDEDEDVQTRYVNELSRQLGDQVVEIEHAGAEVLIHLTGDRLIRISADGEKIWYLNGELHRPDGPAIESADGDKEWWLHDQRHRTDGPAVEWADGGKEWWLNDKRHRTDGPAVERANGNKFWYLNGQLQRTAATFR